MIFPRITKQKVGEYQEYRYYTDKGRELHDGDMLNGKKVYLTDQGELGTDATNPSWIESGRAEPCQYGIYPLVLDDLYEIRMDEDEKKMKVSGHWWNGDNIPLVELSEGVFALTGWNGEVYTNCWKCVGKYQMKASEESYTLRPVHKFELEGIDLDSLDENSDEYESALEIVDYSVSKN